MAPKAPKELTPDPTKVRRRRRRRPPPDIAGPRFFVPRVSPINVNARVPSSARSRPRRADG